MIWVQHAGGLHGFITNVCFDPKERVGAIALINGDGDARAGDGPGRAARTRPCARRPAPIEPPAPLPATPGADLLGLYADRRTSSRCGSSGATAS